MINAIRSIYREAVVEIEVSESGRRTRYSKAQVKQAMALYAKLKTFGGVEKALGISRNTVRVWAKRYAPKAVLVNVGNYNINRKAKVKGRSKVKPADRQNKLVELVKTKAMITSVIAEILDVTVVTIRNDILDLITEGRIVDISASGGARMVKAA